MTNIFCIENSNTYEFYDRIYDAMCNTGSIVYDRSEEVACLRTKLDVILWKKLELACKEAGII